ncbi:hypothetical protein D9757_005876 [Collybiopsis confluens]|uniref:Dienelactone hydrolase domain-containing protein n=1 Tax=Collybiopsis confluens TaxID=2823264 RepID=A0A8H5HNU4_9AGAR|nr:hypothetical protein D9757_005876 [Collybiopsis confluens]
MSFCENCVKGVTHDGEPKGKWEVINGVNSYVATPTKDYPKDKVLLYLADIFGPQLINNRLLADDFANNGFKTIVPDIFNGDPAPADALTDGSTWDLYQWFGGHGQDKTRPTVDKVLEALKSEGVTSFGVLGYCFGDPADLEKYKSDAKAPLLISSCPVDSQFPLEASEQADKIFADFGPGYKREHFEGCTHGFAVRGDMKDPNVKAGKEGAFKATVEWMIKHL